MTMPSGHRSVLLILLMVWGGAISPEYVESNGSAVPECCSQIFSEVQALSSSSELDVTMALGLAQATQISMTREAKWLSNTNIVSGGYPDISQAHNI